MNFQVGDLVEAVYKSGTYIGEIVGFSERTPKAKVRVLAVRKHPDQGDLHRPGDENVPMFFARKALAEREVALVFLRHLQPWHGEVPPYSASLQRALESEMAALQEQAAAGGDAAEFARASLIRFKELQQDYDL